MSFKQKFRIDTAETFKLYIYKDNRKLVATSATLTVYKPGTDIKLLDGVSMSVASDGLLTYDLTAENNDTLNSNYKAEVAYVSGGDTFYTTVFYDIVNVKLHKVITDQDVVNELPKLKENGWRQLGTAAAGASTTSLVDSNLKRFENDHFTGGLAHSLTQDETRDITDFVSSTGAVTTTAFPVAIDGDKYVLTQPYTNEIQRAFEKLEDRLNRMDKAAHLVLDPYDLREPHIYQTVADICRALATDETAIWWALKEEYEMKVNQFFKNTKFKYDFSEDGYISGSEEEQRPGIRRARRG